MILISNTIRIVALVLAGLLLASLAVAAELDRSDVQTAWRLLDYIAVDYDGAVANGIVSNPTEYAEQLEFAATAASLIAGLPASPQQQALRDGAARLGQAIAARADVRQVAGIARELAAALLDAYPVPLAPGAVPDPVRGASLYAEHCARCHGESGNGDGAAAASLPIVPTAFTDPQRARQRSIFALYQVITQGLDDTPMQGYAKLSTDERWALAFFVARLAFPPALVAEGKRIWDGDAALQQRVPGLEALAGVTAAALGETLGPQPADAVTAYLRHHPEAVLAHGSGLLALAREHLAGSLDAYRSGNRQRAGKLALAAYLDGFEPLEPMLTVQRPQLLVRVEAAMGEYRAAIQHGESDARVVQRAEVLSELFDDVEATLAAGTSNSLAAFVGAATILLREGLEALLIVVAMIAFLHRAERRELMPYVHAGWVGALLAGVVTWAVATWAIEISGAGRELTEGFGSVFAALVLLSVGVWMHGKAQADQWQRYIHGKMSKVLSGRSAWLLFLLAFIVVYREVFETILFFAALWTQGNATAMLLGALGACLALALITWVLLRFSQRLPISKFFAYSSWLMAILAVVLAGKGVAALQEAGIIDMEPLAFLPRVAAVGFYPTVQTVLAQVLMILGLLIGFGWNRHHAVKHATSR